MLQEKRESHLPITRFLASQRICDERRFFQKAHLPLVFTQEHLRPCLGFYCLRMLLG